MNYTGNPLSYRDGMSFVWENGRNLKTISTGDNTVTMKYDSNGMRTQKQDDDYTTDYYYDSNNNLIGLSVGNEVLYFYYDTDGNVTGFSHNGTKYYYVKNLQGDVEKIANQEGNIVITYTYDAWGNLLNKTDTTPHRISNFNPYRYRSYMYDNETGLYYLKSRYYDPVTGRFINADIYCDTGSNILGTNMFTYCNNNIVNQIDPEGTDAKWLQFGDAVGGLGHTSLLIQDSYNMWWYFYWGDKHAILRPCGKDDFTMSELNTYLRGFDSRLNHNYFVYATNVYNDKEDMHGAFNSKYWLKSHDGIINSHIYIKGNFSLSYEYAVNIIDNLYKNSNATNKYEIVYENGKKIRFYHVCKKNIIKIKYQANDDQAILYLPTGYYYDIISPSMFFGYNLFNYNCIHASMDVLLKGSFDMDYVTYKAAIESEYWKRNFLACRPNKIYERILENIWG